MGPFRANHSLLLILALAMAACAPGHGRVDEARERSSAFASDDDYSDFEEAEEVMETDADLVSKDPAEQEAPTGASSVSEEIPRIEEEEELDEGADAQSEAEIVQAEIETEKIKRERPRTPPPKREELSRRFRHLDPSRVVPRRLLERALRFFVANESALNNKRFISIIDYSKRSNRKRFFIVDMRSGQVTAVHVAHGKGSDSNRDGIAEKFSNVVQSQATSLGFYRTGEVYRGAHGTSLRLDGLSKTNSNARRRAVVIHAAKYVKDENVQQGRSWGCPAISQKNRDRVIRLLKGGSLIYAGRSSDARDN